MRSWLKNCQVTEIAIESTGQYWQPLCPGRLRGRRGELELALQGTFTGEPRWLLERELRQVELSSIELEIRAGFFG